MAISRRFVVRRGTGCVLESNCRSVVSLVHHGDDPRDDPIDDQSFDSMSGRRNLGRSDDLVGKWWSQYVKNRLKRNGEA